MAKGQINLAAITTRRAPFGSALAVYQDLMQEGAKDVGVVLEYEEESVASGRLPVVSPAGQPRVAEGRQRTTDDGRRTEAVSRLDVIGAGNFARTMLLPHLKGQIALGAVVNQTALSANHVKSKFGFEEAATDAGAVFGGPNSRLTGAGSETGAPGAVLIATRHHLHASLVEQALAANRHAFVEKPLCLSPQELAEIDEAYAKSKGTVMVGFNRRFAPASVELKKILASAPGPKTASFRVMPGKLEPGHWYANYAESGGRVLGEACHFLDYFCFLFDAQPARVLAQTTWPAGGRLPFPDSVTAQVEFADGSCGQLVYSAEGATSFPKEVLTVYGAGVVAETTNFQELTVYRGRKRKSTSYSSKGHAEEVSAWLQFLHGQTEHPLPYEKSRVSMSLTFAVLESIQKAASVDVGTIGV
jgi:predicted dehydrogenase